MAHGNKKYYMTTKKILAPFDLEKPDRKISGFFISKY